MSKKFAIVGILKSNGAKKIFKIQGRELESIITSIYRCLKNGAQSPKGLKE
jgi:hypothetical protein